MTTKISGGSKPSTGITGYVNPFPSIIYADFLSKLVQGFVEGPKENIC
jgi:hypothetical protein